ELGLMPEHHSIPAILFLGNSEADVEKSILQDSFQVYHHVDLNGISTERFQCELTHLVISSEVSNNVEQLIKRLTNLQAVFLIEAKATRLQQLRNEFPGGGVVFRRSTLTPRQSQFLFSRRPRSWPSTSESTIACKRRKQAPREYEDLQYERLTRASSSNNSKLMCIESEVNADHGNKQAVKGQTFGFLQWSPLTLAVARRLQAFGCVMLVADEQLPPGLDHVFGVTRAADQTHLLAQSDMILILDDFSDHLETESSRRWSRVELNSSLLRKAKRGCRLFYFGNSKNSVQQKLVQHIFQTENISQLIIGPGEQDASSTNIYSNVIYLQESLDDFQPSWDEFRKYVALSIRRNQMTQPKFLRIPCTSADAECSVHSAMKNNLTNESRSTTSCFKFKTICPDHTDQLVPKSERVCLDKKSESPYEPNASTHPACDFHSRNNCHKQKACSKKRISFGVTSLVSDDHPSPKSRQEEQKRHAGNHPSEYSMEYANNPVKCPERITEQLTV
ncbi:Zinc finger C2CH type, partial [Fasciolopsis buskii]